MTRKLPCSGAGLAQDTATHGDASGDVAKELMAGRYTAVFNRQSNLTFSLAGDSQAIAGVYCDIVNVVIRVESFHFQTIRERVGEGEEGDSTNVRRAKPAKCTDDLEME